jgi:hypothetical protein
MWLIVVYVILMIAGDLLAYVLGLFIEREWPAASLPTFLAMYFGFLWISWLIAVKITEPKTEPLEPAGGLPHRAQVQPLMFWRCDIGGRNGRRHRPDMAAKTLVDPSHNAAA